jgi:hypothetical protein
MMPTLGAVQRIPSMREERKWNWLRALVAFFLLSASGVAGWWVGYTKCTRDVRADLVKKGFATWIVTDEHGHSEFKLKEKP